VQKTAAPRNAVKMIISTTNIDLRPKRSERLPRPTAPIRIPHRLAAVTKPFCAEPISNWRAIRGRATPVIKTTKPSKNFPAAASIQMRRCIFVIGTEGRLVPSGQMGRSSM
jgi:hypothetical protein